MLTLFSTLISFLMGGLPKLLEFFQDRSDKKHEMALAQLQIQRELEMRKLGFEAQERVEHIKSEQQEMETKSNEKQALIGAQQDSRQSAPQDAHHGAHQSAHRKVAHRRGFRGRVPHPGPSAWREREWRRSPPVRC